MPRVTVNKDSLAVTPLPTPTPELLQSEPVPHVPLTEEQADASPPVFTTMTWLHFLQRILNALPWTLSSAIEYLA